MGSAHYYNGKKTAADGFKQKEEKTVSSAQHFAFVHSFPPQEYASSHGTKLKCVVQYSKGVGWRQAEAMHATSATVCGSTQMYLH